MITRRGLFGILAGAVAAPIVVRSGLLMPVKAAIIMPTVSIGFYRYTGPEALSDLIPDPNVAAMPILPFGQEQRLMEWKSAFEKNWANA